MPKIAYQSLKFRPDSLALIDRINEIIKDYAAQRIELTLRQVYYRLVAAALIPNEERSYKKIGELVSNGRLAGLIDWDAIIDRTRSLRGNNHWQDPAQIIRDCQHWYTTDKWASQRYYVEVWVEKDAQVGIVGNACAPLDVPYFSCRGYTSQTEMWNAANRMRKVGQFKNARTPVVIHLGDHDPSGIDMSRDIEDRLALFGGYVVFKRIALNMDQIEQYGPPPNPTKVSDTRATGYIDRFGHECWELDALEPRVTIDLITETILEYRDEEAWERAVEVETEDKTLLGSCSKRWAEVLELLI